MTWGPSRSQVWVGPWCQCVPMSRVERSVRTLETVRAGHGSVRQTVLRTEPVHWTSSVTILLELSWLYQDGSIARVWMWGACLDTTLLVQSLIVETWTWILFMLVLRSVLRWKRGLVWSVESPATPFRTVSSGPGHSTQVFVRNSRISQFLQ